MRYDEANRSVAQFSEGRCSELYGAMRLSEVQLSIVKVLAQHDRPKVKVKHFGMFLAELSGLVPHTVKRWSLLCHSNQATVDDLELWFLS